MLSLVLAHPSFSNQVDDVIKHYSISGFGVLFWMVNNPHAQSCALMKVWLEHPGVSDWLDVEGHGLLPLEAALDLGKSEMARLLGEDPDPYESVDWSKRFPLVERAAWGKAWDLIPELLAIPVFAEQAGKPGPERQDAASRCTMRQTALYQAVKAGKAEIVDELLKHESVRNSVFETCIEAFPVKVLSLNIPDFKVEGYETSAILKAIKVGSLEILEKFLALPEVRQRLSQDRDYVLMLIEVARNEENSAMEALLKKML
jgi:hypothetical protein